jgi:hypothetical protein
VVEKDGIEKYDLELKTFQTAEFIAELQYEERVDVWWGKNVLYRNIHFFPKWLNRSLLFSWTTS